MTQWVASRTARERVLLVLAGAVLIFALGYQMLWLPARAAIVSETLRFARLQQLLLAVEGMPSTAIAKNRPATPLSTLIKDSATEAGLQVDRLETTSEGGVTALIAAAPFEAVTLWIEGLSRSHGIQPARLSLVATEARAVVTAEIEVAP